MLGVLAYVFLVLTMVFPCHGRTMVTLAMMAGSSVGWAGQSHGDRARAMASFVFVAIDFALLPLNAGWWVNNVLSITASVQFMVVFPRVLVTWKNTDHEKYANNQKLTRREMALDVSGWLVFLAVLACSAAIDVVATRNPPASVLLGAMAVGRAVGDHATLLLLVGTIAFVIACSTTGDDASTSQAGHATIAATVFTGLGFLVSLFELPKMRLVMEETFAFGFVVAVGWMALSVMTVTWSSCVTGNAPGGSMLDTIHIAVGITVMFLTMGVVVVYTGTSYPGSGKLMVAGIISVVIISVVVGVLVGWVGSQGCVYPGMLALVLAAGTFLPLVVWGAAMWLNDVVGHMKLAYGDDDVDVFT